MASFFKRVCKVELRMLLASYLLKMREKKHNAFIFLGHIFIFLIVYFTGREVGGLCNEDVQCPENSNCDGDDILLPGTCKCNRNFIRKNRACLPGKIIYKIKAQTVKKFQK